jgi:hypothetical protein
MQSLGLVNDHLTGCAVRAECEQNRRAADIPKGASATLSE